MSHCRNDAGVAFGYSDIDRDALAWREEIYQDKVAWHRFHLVWSGGRLDTCLLYTSDAAENREV